MFHCGHMNLKFNHWLNSPLQYPGDFPMQPEKCEALQAPLSTARLPHKSTSMSPKFASSTKEVSVRLRTGSKYLFLQHPQLWATVFAKDCFPFHLILFPWLLSFRHTDLFHPNKVLVQWRTLMVPIQTYGVSKCQTPRSVIPDCLI